MGSPLAGRTAKVQAGNIAPGQRNRLAVNRHHHPVAVRLSDRAEELIADDKPGFVLGNIDLEAVRRLREADQLQVVEVARQPLLWRFVR